MKDIPVLNSSLSSSSSSTRLSTSEIGAEEWDVAEEGIDEILSMIQPNVISECRRKEIIEYIQILFGSYYGIKVFPFGSVPLKTYLPDGDIDLTVVCHHDEAYMLSAFCSLLENEEMTNTEIQVRNVQSIPAQVKVVKCSVENISVDISFNQMAGLCALSFLEQVDQFFGKDHLFKRSVILIKSWCFYESRILGAHYGLISTYGLETMVIHIINLFHANLCSPLAVLYKFLTYFSKFDWDEYCMSVNGVILLSSLPEVVVQPPEKSDDPLLSADFLQKCQVAYFVSTGINQTGQDQFPIKFLNIMDPLSSINNLGRSVNKANFSRIKYALSYASEKLEAIFASPVDKISEGLAIFFRTTLRRTIKRGLPVGVTVQDLREERSDPSETSDENENLLAGIQYGLWSHDYGMYQGDIDPISPQNFSRVAKSRGTGTYIPQPVDISEWNSMQTWKRPDSPRPSEPVTEEAEDGINKLMVLSLTEFPLLPGTKPVEIKGAAYNSETAKTPKEVASPVLPKKLPSPSFPPVLHFPPADPPLSVIEEKLQSDAKTNIKEELTVRLSDPKEFPELPILRLQDPADFPYLPVTQELPELPILSLQDPVDFPDLPPLRLQDPVDLPDLPALRLQDPVDFPDLPTLRLQDPVDFPDLPSLRLQDPVDFPDLPTSRLQDPVDFPDLPTLRLQDPVDFPDLPTLRLQDPVDFPDLPTLRLQDPVDFPDLPTLRLQDPKDFPLLSKKQQKGRGRKKH